MRFFVTSRNVNSLPCPEIGLRALALRVWIAVCTVEAGLHQALDLLTLCSAADVNDDAVIISQNIDDDGAEIASGIGALLSLEFLDRLALGMLPNLE